jgi:virginiamycin B lyase
MRRLIAAAFCFLIPSAAFAGWTQMSGNLAQVSVGSATQMWGVQANQQVWQWSGSGWTQILGQQLVDVSVGSDGTVWGVNASGQIYRRDNNNWTLIPGGLVQISVGSATNVWGVNASDQIYRWNGSGWDQVPGGLMYVSAAADGSVWGVQRNAQVWRRDGSTWTQVDGSLANIAVGSANNVWGVNGDGKVYQRTGTTWTEMPGPMKQVAAGADGTVLGVNAGTQLFRWTPDVPAAAAPAPSANGHNVIRAGEVLRGANGQPGDSMISSNGAFMVRLEGDGRLVEHFLSPADPQPLLRNEVWNSGAMAYTANGSVYVLFIGGDGNMCIRQGNTEFSGTTLWCTNKVAANASAFARINDDGSFAVYAGTSEQAPLWQNGILYSQVAIAPPTGGSIQWPDGGQCPGDCVRVLKVGSTAALTAVPASSKAFTQWTGGTCTGTTSSCTLTVAAGGTQTVGASFATVSPSANGSNVMTTGQILRSSTNDFLVSSNRSFILAMQPDGNLCEYRGPTLAVANTYKQTVWCLGTSGSGGHFSVQMHATNNFCVTTGDEWGQGPALWCTNQVGSGSGPAFAMLGDDGSFSVRQGTPSAPGALLWDTGVMSQVSVTPPVAGASIEWGEGSVCPPVCSKAMIIGSSASLHATPPPNQELSGWTGSECRPGLYDLCNFTVITGGAQHFGAEFGPAFPLTASPSPYATIHATSDKLHCPPACSSFVLSGSTVSVWEEPNNNGTFVRWNGDCAGQGNPCTLTMNAPKSVNAFFVDKYLPVDVTIIGEGGLVATESVQCMQPSCTLQVLTASLAAHLTAQPQHPFRSQVRFAGWGGDCAGQGNPCSLDMSSPHAVTAKFEPLPKHAITVTAKPSGGIVGTGDYQIKCGDAGGASFTKCSGQYFEGMYVALSAWPGTGNTKIKWGGDCAFAGNADVCTLVADRDHPVTVEFSP